MIQPPASAYKRPVLPPDDELEASFQPPPPPTPFESLCLFVHRYRQPLTTGMFLFSMGILFWGGLHGINLSPRMFNATSDR